MEQLERTGRVEAAALVMRTPRLDLVAATVAHLDAELVAPARLGVLLGADVPTSWPPGEYDAEAIRFFRERLLAEGQAAVGWYGWYAVRRADVEAPATLVAGGGYFGPPDEEGTVEIGYSVAPEWRGRGIARELAAALVARAWATAGVRRVVARTDETNAASMAVLRHCGFRCTGPGTEPGSRRFEHEHGAPMVQ